MLPDPPIPPPQKSPVIQDSADKILALLEQEREHERQLAHSAARAYYQNILEDYQSRSRSFQNNQAQKLMQSDRELAESRRTFDELQKSKTADEAMLQILSLENQSLKNECNQMRAQVFEVQNSAYLSGVQASHTALSSELKRYGIVYRGSNSLSFEEPWLQLWNQYVAEDPDQQLTSDHRITRKELDNLLQNFMFQIRKDRDSIQTLEQRISVLQDEPAFRSQLTDKHSKSIEIKTETVRPTAHVYDGRNHQTLPFIKSEPGLPSR